MQTIEFSFLPVKGFVFIVLLDLSEKLFNQIENIFTSNFRKTKKKLSNPHLVEWIYLREKKKTVEDWIVKELLLTFWQKYPQLLNHEWKVLPLHIYWNKVFLKNIFHFWEFTNFFPLPKKKMKIKHKLHFHSYNIIPLCGFNLPPRKYTPVTFSNSHNVSSVQDLHQLIYRDDLR